MRWNSNFAGLLIVFAVLTSGCIIASSTKPHWVHDVEWQGDVPGNVQEIETALWTQIVPHKMEYETVNITSHREGDIYLIQVVGISNASQYADKYDFIVSGDTLTRTGYLLEAIPHYERNSAIATAMQNQEVRESGIFGNPTVRRILPETSKKYYAEKTLLSVTWTGVSALVDPQEWRVVTVWRGDE